MMADLEIVQSEKRKRGNNPEYHAYMLSDRWRRLRCAPGVRVAYKECQCPGRGVRTVVRRLGRRAMGFLPFSEEPLDQANLAVELGWNREGVCERHQRCSPCQRSLRYKYDAPGQIR